MSIRVVRYDSKTKKVPEIPGYEVVVIGKYHDLSTDTLKDSKGHILTNLMEFSKVYTKVSAQTDQTWWDYPEETHLVNGNLTKEYWNWHDKGLAFNKPVRYPNGHSHRNKYEFIIRQCESEIEIKGVKKKIEHGGKTFEVLNHAEARIKMFYQSYMNAVKEQKVFTELKNKIAKGAKLAICDVDGPLVTKENGVKCINGNYVDCTKENINEMLNSKNHTFGAGFYLAIGLLGGESWLTGK